MKLLKIIFFIFIAFTINANSDFCKDYLIHDGTEELVSYNIDSTGNWWVVTSPFIKQYRYNINGKKSESYTELSKVTFSPDGEKWAFWAKDNTQWYLVTNEEVIPINCTKPGLLKYTNSSEKLIYSFFFDALETIVIGYREIQITNRIGDFYTSYNGERFAFLGYRGSSKVININGRESEQYENILPIGFWQNGDFLYATKSGNNWEVKLGAKTVLDGYSSITEAAINHHGNAAGLLVRTIGNNYYGVLLSDEYYEPLISKNYERVSNLTMHPFLPLLAFNAEFNNLSFVVFSSTEYSGGLETSKPYFTHDGSELYFFGCNIDCFVNIGGKKYSQNTVFNLAIPFTHKPNSNSIAFTTSSSLIVRDLITNMLYSGMMVDETTNSIYNWKKKRYEALGRINNKVYLLTCAY